MDRARPGAVGRAVALAVEHGVDDFYQGVVPALVPLLVAVRHYDYAQAGGVVLAATILSSVAQPLFGVLADRHHAGWLRTAGLLLAAGGIAAVGVAGSYTATVLAVLVSGLGIAAFHPEAARAVHATGTGDRGMGWFTFGGLAGFALGPPVATAVLGTVGLGATPLLAAPALVVALTAVVRRRAAHPRAVPSGSRSPSGGAPQSGAVPSSGIVPSSGPAGAAPPEDRRGFLWLSAVVMTRSVLFYGLTAFLAVYVTEHLQASATVAALVVTGLTGVGALSTLVSGAVVARLGRARTLLVSYLGAGAALVSLLVSPNVAVAVGVAAVLGVALNLPVPVHTTLGQHFLPRHLGLAAAVTLGLAVSAGGLASPGLGALADRHGITATMLALVALPFLAAVLTAPLLSRHRGRTHPGRTHRCRTP